MNGTTDTATHTEPVDHLRVRILRHRFALSEATARLLALLAYGEGQA